jgi:hypothetical protein
MILISEQHPDKYLSMPRGLDGYWWETEGVICIPDIRAQHEGDGTFTKWIKSLESRGKIIFFPTVVSARLDFILRKHGYEDAITDFVDEVFGCRIEGLAKRCCQEVMELKI